MTEWRTKEKVMADARNAKEAAEEANLAACLAVASGVTARQEFAFREAFKGRERVLPPPPKRLYQGRNTRAEARAEKREVLMTKLTAKVEEK